MTTRRSRLTAAVAAAGIGASTLLGLGATIAHAAPATIAHDQHRPGLLAADRLTVVKDTGEWNGDEPVMLTVRIETVLGQQGSTRVSLVNSAPAEIASGVRAGRTVTIPDRDGDTWFDVKPLSAPAVASAVEAGAPVPVPVVATATVMLEGDFSNGAMIGAMGQTLADHLQHNLGRELENTRIIMTDAGEVSGYDAALDRISEAAIPDSSVITKLAMQKISDWASSVGDPDDPVGVSLTALVPVEQDLVDLIDAFGGASALGLDGQYLAVSTHKVRTVPFDTDVQVRTGLLVPPSALGGTEQNWWTTYAGDYVLDDPVEYRVWTHAWPAVTW